MKPSMGLKETSTWANFYMFLKTANLGFIPWRTGFFVSWFSEAKSPFAPFLVIRLLTEDSAIANASVCWWKFQQAQVGILLPMKSRYMLAAFISPFQTSDTIPSSRGRAVTYDKRSLCSTFLTTVTAPEAGTWMKPVQLSEWQKVCSECEVTWTMWWVDVRPGSAAALLFPWGKPVSKKEADPWRIAELKERQRNGTPVLKTWWTSLSNIFLLDFQLHQKINELYSWIQFELHFLLFETKK